MRRPSPYIDRRGDLDIMMTPMIDVVFLLLVFFVWTTSFQIVERVLPSKLTAVSGTSPADPNEAPPPEEDFDRVVVRLLWQDGQPAWQVNDAFVPDLRRTRKRLEDIARITRNAPVILHPDPNVPLGHVIDLYDITRLVGFTKIQFAASEKI
ncbi:MAG: hypothetical protein FJ276_07280 [Planctomycetes bacterium]|nr:hypothetical protein [Planctomycetota bacterium]